MVINREKFIEILKKFADDPDDILVDKNKIVGNVNGDEIDIEVLEKDEVLFCREKDGTETKVKRWIADRIARLDGLARKIKDVAEPDRRFISVPSEFVNEDDDIPEGCSNTDEAIYQQLRGPSEFATRVVFLLSEAGEGKSMIVDHLAHKIADEYLNKKVDFVFLPIVLEGRPFTQLDEMVIGMLAQRYRSRTFYFEGLLELIKLGLVVLCLDGFEEMLVTGKEDVAMSSLGGLMRSLGSEGKVLISARRAFFEYAMRSKIILSDAIWRNSVLMSTYKLQPWERMQYINLLSAYGIEGNAANVVYEKMAAHFEKKHPILTRPILARQAVHIIAHDSNTQEPNVDSLIGRLDVGKGTDKVVEDFIMLLLEREATRKWLSTSGETRRQLLTVAEHSSMLQMISEEMWLSGLDGMKADVLQEIVEVCCEQFSKTPIETRDCVEKILHHAMITKEGNNYMFIHEAFRKFFLAKQILRYLLQDGNEQMLARIFSIDVFDVTTVSTVVVGLVESGLDLAKMRDRLYKIKGANSISTPASQNVGSLIMMLRAVGGESDPLEVCNVFFGEEAAKASSVKGLTFTNCIFDLVDLSDSSHFCDVTFHNCKVASVAVSEFRKKFHNVMFDEMSLPSYFYEKDGEDDSYDPWQIMKALKDCGIIVRGANANEDASKKAGEVDELLRAFIKIAHYFNRTSAVSSGTLMRKFGRQWSVCENEYLPHYLQDGLLRKTKWMGGGSEDRYVLGFKPSVIEDARQDSGGKYSEFVSRLREIERG